MVDHGVYLVSLEEVDRAGGPRGAALGIGYAQADGLENAASGAGGSDPGGAANVQGSGRQEWWGTAQAASLA